MRVGMTSHVLLDECLFSSRLDSSRTGREPLTMLYDNSSWIVHLTICNAGMTISVHYCPDSLRGVRASCPYRSSVCDSMSRSGK